MPRRYLTAKQLNISEQTHKLLKYAARILPKLSTPKKLNGEIFGFNMNIELVENYNIFGQINSKPTNDFNGHKCGTAGCIYGLMKYKLRLDNKNSYRDISKKDFLTLYELFYPRNMSSYSCITNKAAAKAVNTFLETGIITFQRA